MPAWWPSTGCPAGWRTPPGSAPAAVVDARRLAPPPRCGRATDGRGADVCLELSGAYPALHEAIRATAHAGRVVAAGFYQGQADGLGLGEEFHHNRIQLVAAQVSGPTRAPGMAGRWTGTGSRTPSWTWWPRAASTRCRW